MFVRAWRKFTNGKHDHAFQRGWEKCGLFPLDLDIALAREGSVESGVWTNMGDETTPSVMEKVMFPLSAGKMYAPAVSLEMQEGEVSRREVEAPSGGDREHKQVVLRKFVVDVLTPLARTTTEQHKAVSAMKQAKKTNIIVNGVQFRKKGIPCTIGGCYWSADVACAAEIGEQLADKAEQVQAATDAAKKQLKEAKSFARQQSTAKVLVSLQNNEPSWSDTSAKELCDAANDLLFPQSKITRKSDAVAAFQRALAEGKFSSRAPCAVPVGSNLT